MIEIEKRVGWALPTKTSQDPLAKSWMGRWYWMIQGQWAETVWNKIPDRFPIIDRNAFIIIPNHIHGIVILVGAPLVGAHSGNGIHSENGTHGATVDRTTTRVAPTLGDIVGAIKSLVTVEYTRGVKQSGWTRFYGKLWQRNYYEYIIRDENELN